MAGRRRATLTAIDEALGAEYPELRDMLLVFGSRHDSKPGDDGRNLVTESPIGDSAPVLMALEGKIVLASAAGERVLSIDEFFVSYRKTALQPANSQDDCRAKNSGRRGSVRKFLKCLKRARGHSTSRVHFRSVEWRRSDFARTPCLWGCRAGHASGHEN